MWPWRIFPGFHCLGLVIDNLEVIEKGIPEVQVLESMNHSFSKTEDLHLNIFNNGAEFEFSEANWKLVQGTDKRIQLKLSVAFPFPVIFEKNNCFALEEIISIQR